MAVAIELSRGGASPFVPTQNIEAYIGIDAAVDPMKTHAIWRILSVQIPRSIGLSPTLWPALPRQFHNAIPGRFCSLFLQFKIPIYQDSRRAKYHTRIGGPYFEVGITPHQQVALSKLEARVAGKAVVRYASPAFWSRNDFDTFDARRRVLNNSAYIAPAQIRSHRKWMYAGISGPTVLNPNPEGVPSETWAGIIRELTERASRQSLREHIRSLAASLQETEQPQQPYEDVAWLKRIAQYGRFSGEDNSLLVDLSVVSQTAENAETAWIVFVLPDDTWKDVLRTDHQPFWPGHMWWW